MLRDNASGLAELLEGSSGELVPGHAAARASWVQLGQVRMGAQQLRRLGESVTAYILLEEQNCVVRVLRHL